MTCAFPYESYYVCHSVGEACETCRINPLFSWIGVVCLIGLTIIIVLLINWINEVTSNTRAK